MPTEPSIHPFDANKIPGTTESAAGWTAKRAGFGRTTAAKQDLALAARDKAGEIRAWRLVWEVAGQLDAAGEVCGVTGIVPTITFRGPQT